MPRAPLLAVVALLAAVVLPSAGASAKGEQKLLVILATSGPKPYTVSEVQQTVREADAFFRRSSLGEIGLATDVTPWLPAFTSNPGCGGLTRESFDAVLAPAKAAASLAGYNTAHYDETLYALAESRCAFHGETWGNEVMLTRQPTLQLVLHELGHTLGLGHAQSTECAGGPLRSGCGIDGTGDPFSPMGSGTTDFSAYEKVRLGWIPVPTIVTGPKRYTLATPTFKTTLPQTLVVGTEDGFWWFEYRSQFRGLLVRFVDSEGPRPAFAMPSVLIMQPTKAPRPWVARGETYRIPNSFRVTLERAGLQQARVRFR